MAGRLHARVARLLVDDRELAEEVAGAERASSSRRGTTRTAPPTMTYRPVPTWPWGPMKWPAAELLLAGDLGQAAIDSALMPAKSGTRARASAFSSVVRPRTHDTRARRAELNRRDARRSGSRSRELTVAGSATLDVVDVRARRPALELSRAVERGGRSFGDHVHCAIR